ncbi:MAG: zinc ribbon domain-containing protein [Planctomycetes bacterium]|nr:zinc ribbon domain-containing protein [Planctomycetota bacterium]
MPTYEYKCPDCGHEFEEFQTMTAKPIKVCPACKKRKVKRLIGSGMRPIFKGDGFYETDYVKKSGTPEKTETKSDAKPESKPEAKPAEKKTESKPAKSGK